MLAQVNVRGMLSACLLIAGVPVMHGAPGRTGAIWEPARPSRPFSLPDRLAVVRLPLQVVAQQHVVRQGSAWQVAGAGGSLLLRVADGGLAIHSLSLAGAVAGASVQLAVWLQDRWQSFPLEEPLARDGSEVFAAGPLPLPLGTHVLNVRVRLDPVNARAPVLLHDVRVDVLVAAPAARGARTYVGWQADPLVRPGGQAWGGTPLRLLPRPAFADRSAAVSSLALAARSDPPAIVSRAAWGSPDGEGSPRWVPFYQQPFHIIIHHTGELPGPDGPVRDMQSIWSFHTFTRGWGDIGYNYVIDPQGTIYEGRAGGDMVAGAHTHGFNIGSIGISLIGDYDQDRPSQAMLRSLTRLVTSLANRYGIDVQAVQQEGEVRFAGLAGHRDFSQTDCPGQYVYDLLPQLRARIARKVHSSAALVGPSTLYAGNQGIAVLTIRNTGTTTWNGRFSLRRLSGQLFGLPGGYNVPNVPPGARISVPLFLPALPPGTQAMSVWRLFDSAGLPAGSPFVVGIRVLGAGISTPTPQPPTATPTVTPSATASPTPTAMRTETETHTPTATHTPFATRTATFIPTASATATPSSTATVTPTPTTTATAISPFLPIPVDSATTTSTPAILYPPPVLPTAGRSDTLASRPDLRLRPDSRDATRTRVSAQRPPMAPRAGREGGLKAEASSTSILVHGSPAAAEALGAAQRWYFAEGSTGRLDRETIAFLNPGSSPAQIVTTLLRADGHRAYVVTDVPPGGRGTLDASDASPLSNLLGAIVQSTVPIFAERTEYHASPIEEGTGAALTPGLSFPASRWYLPRMRVAHDEVERLAILNPNAEPVTVRVRVATPHGLALLRFLRLPGLSVRAVAMPRQPASAIVDASNGGAPAGVIAEDSTTYDGARGYTAASGLTSLCTDCYLPVSPAGSGRDYVVAFNPGGQDAQLRITSSGSGSPRPVVVRAGAQVLIPLRKRGFTSWQVLQFQANYQLALFYEGFLAQSGEQTLAQVYLGSVVAAPAVPARLHAFAEGDTRSLLSVPRETLRLSNAGSTLAHVQVTLLAAGGRRLVRTLDLSAGATVRLDLNAWAPPSQHGLIVRADQPILAAHTIDFNEGADRLLSYGSMAG